MAEADPHDLGRFVAAQAGVHERAVAELRAGEKRSHWMWFVFPQLRGLGVSAMAQRYGIASRAEAEAYLAHPVLGPRLREATRAVLSVRDRSLHAIFGSPDDIKFRSSMTLFALAEPNSDSVFADALARYCDGAMDPRTVELLAA